jgi:hypothetical protein
MITRVAKAWDCIMPVGRVMDGPMAVLILSKGTSMQIVLGPVLTRTGGYAFDCWTPEEGLSRGYTYGRIEDAHYARNVEIRSRNKGSSDRTIACTTVDEFVRLTLDLRDRQQRAWATLLPNAEEERVAMEAVYG